MKKQLFIGLAIAFAALGTAKAQSNDPVVMEFDGVKITQSEFVKNFKQANNINPEAAPTACTYEKRKALEEYVDLYANFRLRLHDAYKNKFDTAASLLEEYRTYRNEMALPYLIDSAELNNLLQQTYQRNKTVLHASHIMVRVEKTATPADTIKAYNKAMAIYNRAVAGEDFATLASTLSEDESARPFYSDNGQKYDGNKGDIGCFTVFDMVPEFENAAFSLKPGQISKPIRSGYGYHIIKLHEIINAYGKISIQHINVVIDTAHPEYAENKINEAYQALKNGEDFGTVSRNYSSFAVRGNGTPGLLEDFPIQHMPADYLIKAQNLKKGEYTKPFKTSFGWCIIKLINSEQIPPFEEMQPIYKSKINAKQYGNIPQTKFIESCKKKYNFVDHVPSNPDMLKPVTAILNDSIFIRLWKYDGSLRNSSDVLCEINGRKYTNHDFAHFIEKSQFRHVAYDKTVYTFDQYKAFTDRKILENADSILELNNAEFRGQMEEFRNGLVIFSYNDKMIWSKASSDTAGLREFYNRESVKHDINNPDEALYFWIDRARVTTLFIADSSCMKPSKAYKLAQRAAIKQKLSPDKIKALFLKNVSKKCNSDYPVGINSFTPEKTDVAAPHGNEWNVGVYLHPSKIGYKVMCVTELLPPQLKTLAGARGYYINDYQNELERQLIENLRNKYKLVIHQDVVDSITW